MGAPHRLFFGDPSSLSLQAAAQTAVVTTVTVAATDLSVLVDRRGATLHPMGRVVRPHLQSAETARHLRELTMSPETREAAPPRGVVVREPVHGAVGGTGAVVPGPVDVRLLTMTPRLDGLGEDLPPNRARRAVELVAYLALHQPDVITGDRLRTACLGHRTPTRHPRHCSTRRMRRGVRWAPITSAPPCSPPAPATACTRSRPWSRSTSTGQSHSSRRPGRSPSPMWRSRTIAPRSSWSRASLWPTPCQAIRGGRPRVMGGGLQPYSWTPPAPWWRWRPVQGISTSPGGSQTRAPGRALQRGTLPRRHAARCRRGDADRLRLEWRECCRRVDTLDPGSSPSSRTESLYGELSRRVVFDGATADVRATGYAPVAGD